MVVLYCMSPQYSTFRHHTTCSAGPLKTGPMSEPSPPHDAMASDVFAPWYSSQSSHGSCFNPFTAPSGRISGLKKAHTGLQTVYFAVIQYITNLRWILCVSVESFSRANAKEKKAYGFSNLALLPVVFTRRRGSERVSDRSLSKPSLCEH